MGNNRVDGLLCRENIHLDGRTDRQEDTECLPVSVIEGQCSAEARARDAQLDSSSNDLPPRGLHTHTHRKREREGYRR